MTKSERFLLDLVRRKTSFQNFTLTLSADGNDWRATLQDHDTGANLGGSHSGTVDEALELKAGSAAP
jgi:hypothetical protein